VAADWNGARLRLRWEYAINVNEEAIRLDPGVPSLAIGNPLPTGTQTGGAGLWVGAIDGGAYALRVGGAYQAGPQLLYDGSVNSLALRRADGTAVIRFDGNGDSYFDGPMTIGLNGGIWQGAGSFASPTTGLKIYNTGGVGRLSTYNAGQEQVTINTAGQLVAGQGKVVLDRHGLAITADTVNTEETAIKWLTPAAVVFGSLNAVYHGVANTVELSTTPGSGGSQVAQLVLVGNNGSNTRGALIAGTSSVNVNYGGSVEIDATTLQVDASARISGGLVLGDTSIAPPLSGVLLMKQRSAAIGATPAEAAQLWIQLVGGVQKLYVKFANGVQRELATA
jgi:aspartate 1-decarboxylase